MRRVLHLINTAEVGGGGTHLVDLTKALFPLGYDSIVAVGRPGPTSDRLRDAGIRVVVLGSMGILAPLRVASLVRGAPHDIFHLHGSRSGLVGAVAAGGRRLSPIIYTAHAFAFHRRVIPPIHWLLANAERLTCATALRVICLTASDARAASAIGIDTGRFTVIPNGIDPSRFEAASDRRGDLRIPAGAPIVGFLGRFVPQKDPVRFVQVASIIAEAMPEVHFLMVGDGPLRSAVELAIRNHGLSNRTVLTGFRADIPNLLATMDVLVLVSAWEGLPMVVLEAMAAHRPVVVPDLPGIDEVVMDGITGRIVRGGKLGILAGAVESVLRDPTMRLRMGEAARFRLDERFTAPRMAQATAAVYNDVLGSSSKLVAGT